MVMAPQRIDIDLEEMWENWKCAKLQGKSVGDEFPWADQLVAQRESDA